MSTPPPLRHCPVCSAEIPAEAPQALCPKCLLLGVASAVEPPGESSGSVPGTRFAVGAPVPERSHGRDQDGRAIPPTIEQLGPAFPQLQIVELIGRGGMGFVYKAKQPKLDRFVALKILPGHLAHEPSFHERFEREARVLAKLQHPAIVSVYDFGEATAIQQQGTFPTATSPEAESSAGHKAYSTPEAGTQFFYLLLEYVDGVNLREAMRAGRFTPEQALAIVPQVCEALQYAHSKGVLHRDIKPENILLDTEGRVKIADFGIAKVLGPEIEASLNPAQQGSVSESEMAVTRLTATGSVLGTPLYMAPEQLLRPNSVDHRADIFSLGVVFYEMLTGELPMGRFAPPSEKSLVDQRIDEVVLRALAKERELRQQSADEMKTEVETIASHPQKAGKSSSTPTGTKPAMKQSTGQTVYVQHESLWLRRFFYLAVGIVGMILIPPFLIFLGLLIPYLQQQEHGRAPVMVRPFQVSETTQGDSSISDHQIASGPLPLQSASGSPPLLGGSPAQFSDPHPPIDPNAAPASAAAIEAKRLGLIEIARIPTEVRISQQPIGLVDTEGKVLIEPHFSALVQLQHTTNQLQWTFTIDPFIGQTSQHSSFATFPCDYVACDWSSGRDRPPIIGYLMSPGAYDFRSDTELEKQLRLFNAKDRSEIATLVLALTKNAAGKSAAVSTDWQKATQAAHLRFRLVPKSVSQLDVPDEYLIDLQDDSLTIFARDVGRFTKYQLSTPELMLPLRKLIAKPITEIDLREPQNEAVGTPGTMTNSPLGLERPTDSTTNHVPEMNLRK